MESGSELGGGFNDEVVEGCSAGGDEPGVLAFIQQDIFVVPGRQGNDPLDKRVRRYFQQTRPHFVYLQVGKVRIWATMGYQVIRFRYQRHPKNQKAKNADVSIV